MIFLNKLNGFHQNIQSTYELEKNIKLTFLDVLLIPNKDTIETTVYRKPTNSDIYLNWKYSKVIFESYIRNSKRGVWTYVQLVIF